MRKVHWYLSKRSKFVESGNGEEHMKKHLHGRRHIRARASVEAGRNKRFIRKCDKGMERINRIDWAAIGQSMEHAAASMIQALADFAPLLRREVERHNTQIRTLSLSATIKVENENEVMEFLNGLS
jgi:hypothetical protein